MCLHVNSNCLYFSEPKKVFYREFRRSKFKIQIREKLIQVKGAFYRFTEIEQVSIKQILYIIHKGAYKKGQRPPRFQELKR